MPQTPPTGSVPPSKQQPAHKTGAMPAVPPSGKTGVVPAVHPTGKTGPVPKMPLGPKPGIAKPSGPKQADLPDGTIFSDSPSDQPTVILHAEDLGKNELVEKMIKAEQSRAHPKAPETPHEARQALPTQLYQPPHTPTSQSRPSTPASNSKRIPMVNPHIAKLEEVLRLYGTVLPQIAILELRKSDEWAHILPEEIKKSDDYKAELDRQSKAIGAFYEHVRKLLTDAAYYTTMQANAEQMHQKTAAALEQLAAKDAAIRAKESKMAGAAGLTKSGYQQKVAEIEEERIALAQEKSDVNAAKAAATAASEKLEAERDAFECEKKKFNTDREADTKMMTDLQRSTEMLGQREKAVKVLEEQVNKQMTALQADRKGLDDMVVAYQRDEEALRQREEELKEYRRQNDAVRASTDSVAASLQTASKAYDKKAQDLEARAKEMELRRADFDVVAQKVLNDNKQLEADRAVYDKDRAALDEQVKDIAEQRATLQKGFAQVEQKEHALFDKETQQSANIEKVVEQRIAEAYQLVQEIVKADKDYASKLKQGVDEVLKNIVELSGRASSMRSCYSQEDDKRSKLVEDAYKRLQELTGGNKTGEKK